MIWVNMIMENFADYKCNCHKSVQNIVSIVVSVCYHKPMETVK